MNNILENNIHGLFHVPDSHGYIYLLNHCYFEKKKKKSAL